MIIMIHVHQLQKGVDSMLYKDIEAHIMFTKWWQQ